MKKIFLLIFTFFLFVIKVNASDLSISAKSAILIEESTGKIIYEYNKDERLHPASMTKIMSLILIMEQIDKGKLGLEDEVIISKDAASMGGSQVYVNEGETYKVEELLKGVAISSANDAVVALAEKVSGSKEKFVEEMNKKALKLKLKNTNFVNPHGLDDENHYSTAYDMSIMARELLKHKDILKYTSRYEDYFKKKDNSSIWLVNTNKLVKLYPGMDGLKTGYTENAGYCLTATAMKNNIRLISVVMGEDSIEKRTEDTLKLLNYGFNTIKKDILISKDKKIDTIKLNLTNKEYTNVYLKKDVIKVSDINSDKIKYKYDIKYKDIKLPLNKNSVVGQITIKINDGSVIKEDLVIKEKISKIKFLKLFKKNINTFINSR